jgi:thiosulfate/3-mercaptopyruvate sulfurtransferase
MSDSFFLSADQVASFTGVVVDCRFALGDVHAGRRAYAEGHLPGACYLDLEDDLSAPRERHGGRHPLPAPAAFAARLAALGIDRDSELLIYDDSNYPFAARLWWMLRSLGYAPARLLAGGYSAWLAAGGEPDTALPERAPVAVPTTPGQWPGCCDREQLRALQAQGAQLVDAREAARYRGEQEPIDPLAGHIPGALNRPWQSLISADGQLLPDAELRSALGEDLLLTDPLVVYCGSGVSACVNLLALATLGRDDAWLYAGSWSDWCSYMIEQ